MGSGADCDWLEGEAAAALQEMKTVLPAVVLALSLSGGEAATSVGQPPNLMVMVSDNQPWWAMGCAGNRIISTPHLDQLAREGVRFRNAFVTTPICAASRASLLTGLYRRKHGFTFGTPPFAAKLADFGVSKETSKNTCGATFVGTAYWLAPEIADGQKIRQLERRLELVEAVQSEGLSSDAKVQALLSSSQQAEEEVSKLSELLKK